MAGSLPPKPLRKNEVLVMVGGGPTGQLWGRGCIGEACDGAGAGTDEIGLNVGQSGVGPQGGRGDGGPGIMDVMERSAQFRSDVVIDAHQLFAPVGGSWLGSVVTREGRR